MPAKTPCRYCGRVGFVRFEHVLSGGDSYRHYYCGACDRTWQTADQPASTRSAEPPPAKKTKRSE